MRPATVAAGVLAVAAAGMAVAAFSLGGEEEQRRAAATPTPAAAAGARGGLAVWVEQGCGSCHTFAAAGAQGTIGPDLAQSLKEMPAAYIRESIVAPGAVTAAGFGPGMMPEDYARRIAPRDLQELIAFIRSGVRD